MNKSPITNEGFIKISTELKHLKTVDRPNIIKAIAELGSMGVFAEPAGAAAYAGLVKATSLGVVGSDDPVLVLNTGSGLKDVRAALRAVPSAPVIEPTLEAVKKIL